MPLFPPPEAVRRTEGAAPVRVRSPVQEPAVKGPLASGATGPPSEARETVPQNPSTRLPQASRALKVTLKGTPACWSPRGAKSKWSRGPGTTAKGTPADSPHMVVTVTGPLPHPGGTRTVMLASLQLTQSAAAQPLKSTRLLPFSAPKPEPFKVTSMPHHPSPSLRETTTGASPPGIHSRAQPVSSGVTRGSAVERAARRRRAGYAAGSMPEMSSPSAAAAITVSDAVSSRSTCSAVRAGVDAS